jgi:hypothetical protein
MAEIPAQDVSVKSVQSADPAQTGNATQAVTLTADQVKNMIDESRNSFFAEARRAFEGKQPPAKKPATQESEAEKTLREQVAELQADRKAAADEKRLLEIEKAAVKAGVDASRLDIFVDHVLTRHGNRIQVEGRRVVWLDSLDQAQTLDALITDVMKTRGDIFRPPANVPKARGLQGSTQQQRGGNDALSNWEGLSQAQIAKMSTEELKAAAQAALQATQG